MKKEIKNLALIATVSVVALSCSSPAPQNVGSKNYKTLTIKESSSSVSTPYTASIRGVQYVDIYPQVSGVITDILINEGAEVKRGQTLFIVDQIPYKAALEVARANVKSAESSVATAQINVDSGEALFAESVISENELLLLRNALATAEASLALANAQLISAENDLSYTEIKSPVDGVAGMIDYRVGTLVSSSISDPLVSVSNNDSMYAYFSMSESQIIALSRQSSSTADMLKSIPAVELQLRDGSKYEHPGKVDAISGTIEQSTGTVRLRAKFDNPEQLLRDGGSGRVLIKNNYNNAIVIPKTATFEVQEKMFVFRVVDGKTVSAQINTLPLDNGKEFIVTSGIEVGDIIIAEGAGLLREGTLVDNK
ncbi:MAG: efflux RND transporter periplasmic adaptor subunit [Rikenellaceae bacterium]